MKYLIKITKKNFQFSCDTRISPRTAISAIFKASNQAKFSKTLHSRCRLPLATDTTPGERRDFVMVHRGSIVMVHMSWFMSWFKPLKSTKQMWGGGGRGRRGARAQTQISIPNPFHPWPLILAHNRCGGVGVGAGGGARAQTQISIPNPFHPWPLILTHIHPLNPFTHGPKHSHTPIPTPPLPMAQTQTPTPNPFHLWSPILTHTHPLNPFTHGPRHSHTLIPTPPSPMAKTQTPTPNPFHPWSPILTHTHPLNPFTHGHKHFHTLIPTPPSPMAKTQTPTLTPFTHG